MESGKLSFSMKFVSIAEMNFLNELELQNRSFLCKKLKQSTCSLHLRKTNRQAMMCR